MNWGVPALKTHKHTNTAGDGSLLDIAGLITLYHSGYGMLSATIGLGFQQNATFNTYDETRQVYVINGTETASPVANLRAWRKTLNVRKLAKHFSDIRFTAKLFHFTATETAQVELFDVTNATQIVELEFATTDNLITSGNIQATLLAIADAVITVAVRVKSGGVARKTVQEAYLELRE